jgi:hypothetical protein
MSKWSATKVSQLADWSDAKTLHQDKVESLLSVHPAAAGLASLQPG